MFRSGGYCKTTNLVSFSTTSLVPKRFFICLLNFRIMYYLFKGIWKLNNKDGFRLSKVPSMFGCAANVV